MIVIPPRSLAISPPWTNASIILATVGRVVPTIKASSLWVHGRRSLPVMSAMFSSVRETRWSSECKATQAAAFTSGIIGASAALRETIRRARLAADADCTVLLLGETGTGKELLARALHADSRRASHPFIAVNCGARR